MKKEEIEEKPPSKGKKSYKNNQNKKSNCPYIKPTRIKGRCKEYWQVLACIKGHSNLCHQRIPSWARY
eukprot:9792608-Ditylum_brightwellii.AAC.1